MREKSNEYIRLGIGSETETQKAKRTLNSLGNIGIVKIENRIKDGGCLYGLRIEAYKLSEAVRILRENGIYSSIIK